jgi:hypothetical protein
VSVLCEVTPAGRVSLAARTEDHPLDYAGLATAQPESVLSGKHNEDPVSALDVLDDRERGLLKPDSARFVSPMLATKCVREQELCSTPGRATPRPRTPRSERWELAPAAPSIATTSARFAGAGARPALARPDPIGWTTSG